MNFYALVGRRGAEEVKLIDVNQEAQNDLTARLEPHVTQILRADHVDFAPGYQPTEGEILTIGDYEWPANLEVLMNAADATDLPRLDTNDIEQAQIRGIAAVDWTRNNRATVAVQRIEPRYLLRAEGFRIVVARGRFVRDARPGLEIEDRVDAVYQRATLYVASLPRTQAVLDFTAHLREATIAETRTSCGTGGCQLVMTSTWSISRIRSFAGR